MQFTGTADTGPWHVRTADSGIAKLYQFGQHVAFVDLGNCYLTFTVIFVMFGRRKGNVLTVPGCFR